MENSGKDKIEALKREYKSIPVPNIAKDTIEKGIAKAKKEGRKNHMIKFTKGTALTAAAAICAITVLANLSPVTANAMENIPVLGAIAKVVTFRTFEDKKNNYQAKIEIPKVSAGESQELLVNQSIEEYAEQFIKEYEEEVASDLSGEGHYSVTSTYDVVADNEKYLSLRINTTVVMASGTQYVKIFNVDKATGKVITLDDLFKATADYKKAISDNIKEQMKTQMETDESKMYFYNTGEEASEDFNEITGNESFYFNERGELVLVFNEYEVAPGYMGAVEFVIPNSVTGF